MPKKNKTKKIKSKNDFKISMYILYAIFFMSAVYIMAVWLSGGIVLFFDPFGKKNIISFGKVEYITDKTEYAPGEKIKLALINNMNESIYLAPCKYFNSFEIKKISGGKENNSNEWQPFNYLKDFDCEIGIGAEEEDSFNKIKKITDKIISTQDFGAGTYRGISTIYLQCDKPDIISCKSGFKTYSNEFKIIEAVK